MWSIRQRKSWKHICRIRGWCLAVILAGAVLAGCGKNTVKKPAGSENREKSSGTWRPMKLSEDEKKQAEKSVQEAAGAYGKIYPYQEQKAISEKDRKKVVEAMGKKGLAAVDCADGSVMENSRRAEEFYEKVQAGKTADMTIIRVSPSGGFSCIWLKAENGNVTGILATAVWDQNGSVSISELVKYKVKQLEITEDHKMICEFYLSDQAEMQSDGTMEFGLQDL